MENLLFLYKLHTTAQTVVLLRKLQTNGSTDYIILNNKSVSFEN